MPITADELEQEEYAKILLIGPPKLGKTTVAIATSPARRYVINCDPKPNSALRGALRRTREFDTDRVLTWNEMRKAMVTAQEGVAAGKYKTIVLDPFSTFAGRLIDRMLAETDQGKGPDGRRAYPACAKRLEHVISFFLSLPCHFICVSHYIDVGGEEIDNQLAKTGKGVAPLLPGKSRVLIPAMFDDVIWMDLRKGERVFQTSPEGVWGPGCRSLEGVKEIPASIRKFLAAIREQDAADKQRMSGKSKSTRKP